MQEPTKLWSRLPFLCRMALAVTFLPLLLTSCGEPPFDRNSAADVLDTQMVELHGEQVALQQSEIACGEEEGLWVVSSLGGGRKIIRRNDPAVQLGFSDDILIETGVPHAQVNGMFRVRTKRATSLEDIDEKSKLLKAAVGIVLDHRCFPTPLLIMGVRKGQFRDDEEPSFVFQQVGENQWAFDRLVH